MARKKARKVTHVRLDDQAEHVLNQYRQSLGTVKKNTTECLCALIASWGNESAWKKMTKKFQPRLLEPIIKPTPTPDIETWKKTSPLTFWDDPRLDECPYRDLEGTPRCRNKKPPANLMTDDLRPEICLTCQELRKGSIEVIREYQEVQRAFRAVGGKRVSLVVGLKKQLEVVEAERDDYKQRYQDDTKTLHSFYQTKLNRKDAKIHDLQETIKQLSTSIGDLNLKIIEKQRRIKKLEAILADPEKLEHLTRQNQILKRMIDDLKSKLERLRNKHDELLREKDQLSKELEIAQQQEHPEPMVMCPKKGKVTLNFCQNECPEFIDCGRYARIREQLQSEG